MSQKKSSLNAEKSVLARSNPSDAVSVSKVVSVGDHLVVENGSVRVDRPEVVVDAVAVADDSVVSSVETVTVVGDGGVSMVTVRTVDRDVLPSVPVVSVVSEAPGVDPVVVDVDEVCDLVVEDGSLVVNIQGAHRVVVERGHVTKVGVVSGIGSAVVPGARESVNPVVVGDVVENAAA